MKTFEFKLCRNKRNKYLHETVSASASIYNHCIALHKRYYGIYGKHLNKNKLQGHIAKKRRLNPFWQLVGSQAVQDIVERIDRAYRLFFKCHAKGVRPPNFKKWKKYKSFTLKQSGYKFLGNGRIRIGQRVYRFWASREIDGKVKTVTVKRNPLGEFFIYVVTDHIDDHQQPLTGKSVGLDFGLKNFLHLSDDTKIESPQFFKQGLSKIKAANRQHSRKKKGSKSRNKARKNLARVHEKIANQRKDWFWKLAHELTDKYDYLYFETLNLKGMQRLWGRKISDLAFGTFLKILEYVAFKKGKAVHYIDRWYPSSKTCHSCNHKLDKLDLSVRFWRCPSCGCGNDRDLNAAKNILREGASSLALGDVRPSQKAIAA